MGNTIDATRIREQRARIIGSAIAGIGAFLSWFYESGLLAAIVGIVIAAGITFFVQQNSARALSHKYERRRKDLNL